MAAEMAAAEFRLNRVFYPFLFTLFPALFLYTNNLEEAAFNVLLLPLAASLILVVLFWLPARLLLRDRQKAGLLTFIFSFMFFSCGHILAALFPLTVKKSIYSSAWTIWAWGLLFLILAVLVIRCRCSLNTLTGSLNIFVVILLVFPLWQIASFHLRSHPFTPRMRDEAEDRKLMLQKVISRDKLPDIYYLIFDRYASKESLRQFYDFDNHPFYSMLEGKGFFVAYESRCNHPATYLSLCSSLNMELLPDLLGKEPVQKRVIYRMLNNSRVLRLVKGLGYTYIHFGSWYEPTKTNHFADINFPGAKLTGLGQDFAQKFLNYTALAFVVRGQFFAIPHRRNVLQKFIEMAQTIDRPGPKFIFLHMLVPHAQFVFGPEGQRLTADDLVPKKLEQNYVNQIKFLNTKIEELIHAIMSRSKIPPIIIIQSDEGPSTGELPINHLNKFKKRKKSIVISRIRRSILNAYLFPGQDRNIFYDEISPVNTFRLLFNSYFKTRYSMLPDNTFYTQDAKSEILGFKVLPEIFFRESGRVHRGEAADLSRRRSQGSQKAAPEVR
jgi:hypothetical protein